MEFINLLFYVFCKCLLRFFYMLGIGFDVEDNVVVKKR